ncbi:alpha-carbonic anhydrase [Daphnia sinensis]|uniref:Carbonic anhydrase n=1 Tax=Daphnia sinensis TaxID=1820382 RepID=A0AAD5Q1E8_9CRUS|nr:alpha-carbonic anhydrase [Daphnia sinensis]
MSRSSVITSLVITLVFFRLLVPTTSTDETLEALPATSEAVKRKWTYSYRKPDSKSKPAWSHKDPEAWIRKFPTCGGKQQSPINIQPNLTVITSYPNFKFHNYGFVEGMELINNGHSAAYNLPINYPKKKTPHISGGGLDGIYQFAQIHMHWGNDSSKGSEHLIKSKSYPAEMHLVHWNVKYGSFAEASKYSYDGLAVLTIFAKVVPEDNKSYQPLVEQLGEIIKNGDETILRKPVSLFELLPKRTSTFYRYFGSVTTPACQEIVIWTIFDKPIEISEKQLNKFRSLKDEVGDRMVDNFRPPQPVNDRTVFYRSHKVPDIPLSVTDPYSPFSDAYKWSKSTFKNYANRFWGMFDPPAHLRHAFCRTRPC